jgi:hypothetical protein
LHGGRAGSGEASHSSTMSASTGRFFTSGPQWSMVSSGMFSAAVMV